MRTVVFVLAMVAFAPLAPLTAHSGQNGPYTMTPAGDATIRLNTQTGAVSLCHRRNESWVCEAVDDNHIDLQREAARLKWENEALRAEVIELKKDVRRAEQKLSEGRQDRIDPTPGKETVDEMMAVLEKMIRRFQDMVDSLEQGPTPKQL